MNTQNFYIRQLKKSDLQELSKLATDTYTDSFAHLYTPEELIKQIEEYRSVEYFESVYNVYVILVAVIGEELVGYVQFGNVKSPFPDAGPGDRELGRLYVKSSHQNQGIGTGLVDSALAHPTMKQAANIYLDVWSGNKKAQKLYKRYSFRVIGELPYYRDGRFVSNDLIMVRKQ